MRLKPGPGRSNEDQFEDVATSGEPWPGFSRELFITEPRTVRKR